ncbi:type IV pilus secretin PilQ [Sedimenticola thiotaurini]|uniref:Pilus assembly protein PilQ n=1 Tax=Sedimenticola thiotaurini TaxID=1543721 RepID=A0A0F7K142_9GAMM|nr:type IV pilus secretin PilQ [Sedimenticola thiotaurini]AKH22271.1 pilus assembly protein PilQ [Sedimenticola thiotaurini]
MRGSMNPLRMFWAVFLLFATFLTSVQAAENTLKELTFSALPGDDVVITLRADGPIEKPQMFTTDNPARIALDFFGMSNGLDKKTQAIGIGMARSVTAIEAGDRTRVVVNLIEATGHDVAVNGNQLEITIKGGAAVASSSASGGSMASTVARATGGGEGSTDSLRNVDFRRGDGGEGQVILTLGNPAAAVDLREEGGRVVLDILDTSLPENLMRKFDVGDFATPVKQFEVTSQGDNVHIEITTKGEYEHLAYQANDLFTVEFRALTKEEREEIQRRKETFTGERLSLNFQDIEVRAVLQLLADFTGLNLVTSDTVTGNITLRLKNVPWDQALSIIMKTRGLSMRQNGNVLLIAPTEEIAAREKLELESQRQIEELAPLFSEYIQLNYAKAEDIQKLLKAEGNQLLTPERGNVTYDERTNTLLVRDTAAKLDDIRRLINRLDIAVRQVLIESRVVIANDDFARDIGVRFGLSTQLKQDGNFLAINGTEEGYIGNTAGLHEGSLESPAGDGMEGLLVNLPQTLSTDRGGALNFIAGKIGSYLLQLELSAMQQEGKGEIVSSPRVVTSDQSTAVIKQGVEIPYQEASSSGATSVSFKEAVLKLEVTPHITPDDRVIMDLSINKDNADFTRSILGVPPLDTRSIETSVLVENGETVVLGGVFEREETVGSERIPFFGDLPYVGFMFKQELRTDNNKELLIFVTPKILKDTLSAAR